MITGISIENFIPRHRADWGIAMIHVARRSPDDREAETADLLVFDDPKSTRRRLRSLLHGYVLHTITRLGRYRSLKWQQLEFSPAWLSPGSPA